MHLIPFALPHSRLWLSAILAIAFLAVTPAADAEPLGELTPARGHYAKLQALGPEPASDNLEVDAFRFENNPASIERLRTAPREEFIRVPLDEFLLPAMPASSSAQTRAELDFLLRLQAQRTDAEAGRALYFAPWGYSTSTKPGDELYDAYRANLYYVGRSVGTWLNADSLPLTSALLHRVWRDASYHVWALKFKYSRVRPVVLDSRIKNLQETNWAAFPSGHASFSHILALLYSELAPEFSDIFLKDARDIAHSREIIGVHYPSDSESGRVFAQQFVARLHANPEFAAEFEKVRAEWNSVRAASPD
ncbi:MAG TPA: phosphatase PAP2 family protein [Opitutaceae bacterium]|nr:phosphatase PAP2 family protein [Opitutaceae bacterium]